MQPSFAKAADNGEHYSYYLIACSDYLHERQSGQAAYAGNLANSFYIAGWLSAYNRARPDEGIPDDVSLGDITLWLDGYCHNNPGSNLEEGLYNFKDESKPRHAEVAKPQPAALQKPVAATPHKHKKKTVPAPVAATPPTQAAPQQQAYDPFNMHIEEFQPLNY